MTTSRRSTAIAANVAVLVRSRRDRQHLADWLTDNTPYEATPVSELDPEVGSPFDCYLLDAYNLDHHAETLQSIKNSHSAFIPFLLFVPLSRVDQLTVDVWDRVDEIIWHSADETSMLDSRHLKFELQGRLRNLIQQRETTADLDRRKQVTRILNRILRHNLRNDLNVIQGYVSMLAAEFDSPPEYYTVITRNIEQLRSLTNKARIFDEAVERTHDTETYSILELFNTIAADVRSEYPAVTFRLDVPDDATVQARPPIKRALLELIENAAKHGGADSIVTVSASQSETETRIRITDTGPGLSDLEREAMEGGLEEALSHGGGLGHAMVNWIVSNHDGAIDTTVNDRGTTITITLPRRHADEPSHDVSTSSLSPTDDRFKAVFETTSDAIVLTDDQGRVIEANSAAGELFETQVQEMHGRHLTEFVPDELWSTLATATGEEPRAQQGEVTIGRSDGSERFVFYSTHGNLNGNQRMLVLSNRTEQIRYRDRMRELYETSLDFSRTQDVDEVGDIVCDAIQDVLGFRDGGLAVADSDQEGTVPVALTDGMGEILGGELDVFPDESLPDQVIERGDELVVDDLSTTEFPEAETLPPVSLIGIPLEENEAFVGFVDDRSGEVSTVTLDLARLLATATDTALSRIRRERALRESERRLSLALEAAGAGVWEWDMESDEVLWNETMEQLLGLEPGAFEGTFEAFLQRVHPQDGEQLEAEIDRTIAAAQTASWEVRLEHADGSYRWFDTRALVVTGSEGTPSRMIGVGIDTTETKKREKELLEAETIFEQAQDAMFLIDVAADEFRIKRVNEAYEEVVGLSRAELKGKTPTELAGSAVGDEIAARYNECIQRRETTTYEEMIPIEGEKRYWETKLSPVIEEGSVVSLVGTTRDITDRKYT